MFELFQHGGSEIHVHALDGFHHAAGIGEETRDILDVVRQASNGSADVILFLRGVVL